MAFVGTVHSALLHLFSKQVLFNPGLNAHLALGDIAPDRSN